MTVLRANVDFAKRIFADRVGNDYVYGGNWSPTDTNIGTDCSGLVIDILDACVNGTRMAWTRHGMSTESWRPIEVGQVGPFGTITVAHPRDFPPDAAVLVALHHGPGGGAASHMWCECDGVRMESNGSDGAVTGSRAMNVRDTSYANDWAYLPGPIVDSQPPQPVSKSDGYALAIIHEGQRRGITPRGIQIALATCLVESNLVMYANAKVPESLSLPHDAVGSDGLSVGLFQQQVRKTDGRWWWGDAATCMDPTRSAGLFYDRLARLDYNRGDPGAVAQQIQRSAYPDRYEQRFGDAVALYNRLAVTVAPEEDFLSALTPDEQRRLYERICGPQRSRSPLHRPGEGPIGDIVDLAANTDGSTHVLVQYLLGVILRSPTTIAELQAVAASNDPNQQGGRRIAQAMLNKIAIDDDAGQPTVPPAVAPQPVSVPPPPPPVPPDPPPVPPPGGGLASAINNLDADITSARRVLAELTNQLRS